MTHWACITPSPSVNISIPTVKTTLLFFLTPSPIFPYFSRAILRKGTLGTTSRRGGAHSGKLRRGGNRPAEAERDLGMAQQPAITCADFIAVPGGADGGRDYSHGRFEGKETSLAPSLLHFILPPSAFLSPPSVRLSLKTFYAGLASGQKGRLSGLATYLPIAQDLKECSARTQKLPA